MVRASLTFGAPAAAADSSSLTFANANQLTAIGQNAFKGTKFSEINLSSLPATLSIGSDAFSAIIGLTKVTMSPEQATRINPGVFSGADSAGGDQAQSWSIEIKDNSNNSYSPTNLPTTLTPSSNLNKFTGVQTINLAATSVTTLAGPVFNPVNANLTKLVLPATATNWQLTEPTDYTTSPIGGLNQAGSGQGIEFTNFGNSNTAATSFADINWALVASILNMFGRVEADKGKDTNLAIWSEGKWDRELTATTVKSGWTKGSEQSGQPLVNLNGSDGTWTREYNGVLWTYTANSSGTQITLTAKPNAYKAGYTGNANAFFQVGFGSQDGGKIDANTTVEVKLTLVPTPGAKAK